MRHLKTFESYGDLTSDNQKQRERQFRKHLLEDMSLELCDNNFDVRVSSDVLKGDDGFSINDAIIVVRMEKKRAPSPLGSYGAPRFHYNDVKDTLLSMISYMELEGYTIEIIKVSNKYVHSLIAVELDVNDEKLYSNNKQREVNYLIGELIIKFKE